MSLSNILLTSAIYSPLFTTYMYKNLGTQWASSIPAFLALVFAPLPFVFLKFGAKLRANSKFANEAKVQMAQLMEVRQNVEKKFQQQHAADEEAAVEKAGRESDSSK